VASVTIYSDANYQGVSQDLGIGRYDDALQQISIGNDKLSSLKMPAGFVVRLYEHFHFQGQFIDITQDTPAVSPDWNDKASSIIVYAKTDAPPVIKEVIIFADANYQGNFQILQTGKYDAAQLSIGNDRLSSALVPNGMVLRLFENTNFQGASIDIRHDTPAVSMDWNDRTSSIMVLEAANIVLSFPENEIGLLDEQSFTFSRDVIPGIQAGLNAATITITRDIPAKQLEQLVTGIISARQQLNSFLSGSQFNDQQTELHSIMEPLSRRDLDAAQKALTALITSPGLFISITAALRSTPVTFAEVTQIIWDKSTKPPTKSVITSPRTLPGYTGPSAPDGLVTQLNFMAKGSEYQYRVNLLQAEIYVGQSRFLDAENLYSGLLPLALPADSLRQKFITIRLASAKLARGDALFRKFRSPDEETKKTIRAPYQEAINLMQSSAVSPDNPRRQQIEGYARVQLGKLDAGMNFLGYKDSYVPVVKPEILRDLAAQRIERADQAIEKFRLFTSTAEQIQDQLKDLQFDSEIKAKDNEAAQIRVANANDQVTIANERVDQIQSQLDSLDTDLAIGVGSALLNGVASGFLAGGSPGIGLEAATNMVGVAGAAGGLASTIAGYSARKDDLETQIRIANIESGIAGRNVEIAKLEQDTLANTLEYLGEKIERIQERDLNPDLYYAAGETFRALAEQHLNAAIELAYLFERAVAFLRLDPELEAIQFDYLPLDQGVDAKGNILTAAGKLADDLDQVAAKNVPITRFDFLPESYSLRIFYPLEFSRFLQTGEMEFTFSLYELNKRRPAVWRQRIKRVNVEIRGSIPITGYTGRLIHHGSFLIRDKDTTPEPGTGRFMPTDQELADAFEQLKNGAAQGMSIKGVIPLVLDEGTKEISPDQIEPDLGDPSPGALRPIEGYGPAGAWKLIVKDIDLRFITDVILHITYVIPESDNNLAKRVEGLIATYEQELSPDDRLDLITPFSLRQQFSDAFFQLMNGKTDIPLQRQDFPSGITNLRLKMVIAQALDKNKKGINGLKLQIIRPETTLNLERTTHPDGFSEDFAVKIPSLPVAERFPVDGTYTLCLTDPNQAGQLDDLILFFMYEFTEV
jgi:hypothetical protein